MSAENWGLLICGNCKLTKKDVLLFFYFPFCTAGIEIMWFLYNLKEQALKLANVIFIYCSYFWWLKKGFFVEIYNLVTSGMVGTEIV